jgi:hypothetical protein
MIKSCPWLLSIAAAAALLPVEVLARLSWCRPRGAFGARGAPGCQCSGQRTRRSVYVHSGARRRAPRSRDRVLTSERITAERFELLDARGSLRLVTDAVHEDDALCLALASRALRDALWARFPPRPAGGAPDRPWPGPRADWDMWNISEIAARHARGAGLGAVGAGKVLRQGLEDKQTMH